MANGEIISGINPARIAWCCEQSNQDLSSFSDNIKIDLDKLKQGLLTFTELRKIAEYFGYGDLFFLEKGIPDEQKIYTPEFRTLANQEIPMDYKLVKLIRNLEKHRDIYFSLLEEMREKQVFEAPNLTGATIEDKARQVREWLQLDNLNTEKSFRDYREAIERKTIFVVLSAAYQGSWRIEDPKLEGFSMKHENLPIICIRKSNKKRQVFTLFHELGHLLLHGDLACMDTPENLSINAHSRKEKDANEFAGKCLLPKEIIQGIYDKIPDDVKDYDEAFKDLSDNLCVSVESIVVRLLNEKKIIQKNYDDYKEHKEEQQHKVGSRGGGGRDRYKEPVNIFGSKYVNIMLSALDDRLITLNKASDYLDNLKIKEFKKLRDYALHS